MTARRVFAGILVAGLVGSLFAGTAARGAEPSRLYVPLVVRDAKLSPQATPLPVVQGGNALTPSDLQAAYRIPATAITTKIAVVDAYDDVDVESNLATYRAAFGLPECSRSNGCLSVVNETGGTNLPAPDSTGWAGETDLDVQMVSAACPTCHILVVEANSDGSDLDRAVAYAASQANYVSMSWGSTEDWQPNDVIPALATRGKVFTAASGDEGYGGDSPGYPATDPNVVSVGGTSLTYAGGVWHDTVWQNLHGASGSGCSLHEPQPSWQATVPRITAACGRRLDNDVSIVADPLKGVAAYSASQGGWGRVGGTSAGAPLIAALYAIANARTAPSTSVSGPQTAYLHPSAFRDVTSGTNGECSPALLCTAAVGYDGPSGLGVPLGVAGFSSAGLTTQASAVTISRSRSALSYGQSVTIGGTVTDKASGARLSGVHVLLQASTGGAWSTVRTVTSSSTGVVSAAVAPARATSYRWYVAAALDAKVVHAAVPSAATAVTVKIAKGTARITGTVRAGHRVRVKTAGWAPRAVTYRVVWYVGSKRVGTGSSLALKKAWRGKSVRAVVTARASGLQAVSARTSARRVTK